MRSVLVGRGDRCDVVLADPTVSRRHIEIVEMKDGKYLIVDQDSTAGTFVAETRGWKQVTHARVAATDRIRLGGHETTVDSLLRLMSAAERGSGEKHTVAERDPETGEIIMRKK